MSNTNNQSLGKLAKNTAKGLVRVPLQGIKTATNVTNHTFKGISKASKAVESTGETIATAGETVSIAAKIGKLNNKITKQIKN